MMKYVWVFNGNGGYSSFPSAIFKKKKKAVFWIKEHKLSGTLTRYPIDIPFSNGLLRITISHQRMTFKGVQRQ